MTTKHGDVHTDHVLFIASGAFHAVKPSDLLAELQGRLPIRVELKGLSEEEMYTILTQTENNLIQQQIQLLLVDGLRLTFTEEAIREVARGQPATAQLLHSVQAHTDCSHAHARDMLCDVCLLVVFVRPLCSGFGCESSRGEYRRTSIAYDH